MLDLSVITVTWNSAEKIINQISSVIFGCKDISYEQIIADNHSSDDTFAVIKNNFPKVILLENEVNEGFSAANNQALKLAKGEFILFLNPDMKVRSGTLDIMVNWMREHKDAGIAGCKLIKEDGGLNLNSTPRRFPKIFDQLAIIFKFPHLFPGILNKYLFRDFDSDKEQEVDSIQGSFMLVRREILAKLGWAFDPRYFIWFEDVDLCREVKKMGFKVMYTPIVSCIDYGADSFKKRSTWWKQKQFIKSMIKYFFKWGIKS